MDITRYGPETKVTIFFRKTNYRPEGVCREQAYWSSLFSFVLAASSQPSLDARLVLPAVSHGRNLFLFLEKLAEGGLVREVKPLGNLPDGDAVVFEQGHGLVRNFIADDGVRRFPHHLAHHPGEVFGRDAEGVGIELDVVLLGKMFRDKRHEVEGDKVALAHIGRHVVGVLLVREHAVAQLEAEALEVDTGQFAAVVVRGVGDSLFQKVELKFEPVDFARREVPDAYVGVLERVVQGAGAQILERFAGKLERDEEAPSPQVGRGRVDAGRGGLHDVEIGVGSKFVGAVVEGQAHTSLAEHHKHAVARDGETFQFVKLFGRNKQNQIPYPATLREEGG